MAFKGYFFSTIEKANNAVTTINKGEGLPKQGATTISYCEPAECVGGYYLPFDEVTSKYLSGETDVELIKVELF